MSHAAAARRTTGTFRAFQNYNYRLYWSGQVVSVTGTWMQRIAQDWLVLRMTDSPFALGTISAVQFTPILMFSLFGGVFADRVPKVRMLTITQSVMAAQSLIFAVLVTTGLIELWEIYILTAVLGTASAMDVPTRQAFVMEMVGPDDVPNAVALNSIQFNVARIIGPALGGFAIAAINVQGCLFVNTVSFGFVIVALLLMHQNEFFAVPPRMAGKVLAQLVEGVRYALTTRDIAVIVIVLAVIGTFGYNFTVMLPLVAKYPLHSGPGGFGLLTSAMGVGSVLAGLMVARGKSPRLSRLFIGASGLTVLLFLLGFASSWWFAVPVVMGLGVFSIIFQTTANTRLQLLAPAHMRGRIMSIYQLLFAGTTPIGGTFLGYIADTRGVGSAIRIASALCVVGLGAGVAYLRFGPRPKAGDTSDHLDLVAAGSVDLRSADREGRVH
jgi:MFS family permease